MALNIIDKDKTRKLRYSPGSVIQQFTTGDLKISINKELIAKILYQFGVGPAAEDVHKIEFTDKKIKPVYVNDAGLAQAIA